MAQLISVKLARFDGSAWGFRLQGGKDFGTPLIVQKVNGGSPAEAAGLRAGDAVIRVNNVDMFSLRHKDAQDVIVRAGNSFEMTVQRGGSTWRPSVSPVTATIPSPQPAMPVSNVGPVTKTSLAAKKTDGPLIGSGHNLNPKPFSNGTHDSPPIKSIVNKQYNSPVGIYSEQTIAETLSAQAEVLAGGVLGVNFKKNEKNYNANNSEVFKMVQEADKEPRSPEPICVVRRDDCFTGDAPKSLQPENLCPTIYAARRITSGHSDASTDRPDAHDQTLHCHNCDRVLVGVFVRIKEKNLHVECFKCSTCGTSLKNVGYYNINNKLYCDIHAKLVARQQAPAGYVPITISPSAKAPAGTISAALGNIASHSPLSPPLNNGTNITAPYSNHKTIRASNFTGEYKTNGYNTTNGSSQQTRNGGATMWSQNGVNEKTYTSTITIKTGSEVGKDNDTMDECSHLNNNKNLTNQHIITCERTNFSPEDDEKAIIHDFCRPHYQITNPRPKAKSFLVHNLTKNLQNLNFPVSNGDKFIVNNNNKLVTAIEDENGGHEDVEKNGESNGKQGTLPTSRNLISSSSLASFLLTNRPNLPATLMTTPDDLPTSTVPMKISISHSATTLPSDLGTPPTDTLSTARIVQTHPSTISGPKPFGGSSCVDQPSSQTFSTVANTNTSTFPRPQTQTVTGRDLSTILPPRESYHSECNYYEDVIDQPQSSADNSRPSSSVRGKKSLQWPPVKSIEDITYPTASPIWIDPNPVTDRRSRHVQDRRTELLEEVCRKSQSRNYATEVTSVREDKMEKPNCNAPFYRKTTECTETRRQCRAPSLPRPESADSGRRSLTPTRITQPTPRPWIGTVTASDSAYGHVEAPKQDPPICQKICTCRIVCERTVGPAGPEHEQEHTYHEVRCEVCNPPVCQQVEEMVEEPQEIVCEETDNEVVDLSKIVPEDVAVCPKGVENQHNMYTETMEKDEGNIHIKKTTVYEKTVEILSPRACSPVSDGGRSGENDREVEGFSDRRRCVESAEVVSSAIETNRLIEEARREEEERCRVYEEQQRREQEARRRALEEEEQREANRQRLLKAEKEEKERRMEEQRRQTAMKCRQEEEERSGKHVNFSQSCCRAVEESVAPCEVYQSQRFVREETSGPEVMEERYRELKEEIQIQENMEQMEQEHRQTLREQVEVHKCLREQQQVQTQQEKRPSLQERRLTHRFRPQSPPEATSTRKHVQFMTETESGPQPLPMTSVKNATAKEWKSEMVKALTTAPVRPYSPLQPAQSISCSADNRNSSRTMYTSQVTYEETCRPCPATAQPVQLPPEVDRPVSPFTAALTTAPERSYNPLNYGRSGDNVICVDRSATPTNQMTAEGYCHPAELLYTDVTTRQSRSRERTLRKVEGPRPLPTPPPDYRFRECSASPACSLPRPETPKDRSLATGLKKPGAIPAYQLNLVAMQQEPVEARPYTPTSRTPTPCGTKSPAPGPPEPPACYVRAHAPRIREDSPPPAAEPPRQVCRDAPSETKRYSYHMQENTPQSYHSQDFNACRSSYADEYSCRQREQYSYVEEDDSRETGSEPICGISQISREPPSLPCPIASQSAVSERIQRTGVRVLPTPEVTVKSSSQVCESRRICHQERTEYSSSSHQESECANTGVTVLPCRAISDSGARAGVVIIPAEGRGNNCPQAGVRVTPTPDRSLCVSPASHGRSASSCNNQGGPRAGGCQIDVGNCPAAGVRVGTCTDGSVCVTPCKLPGVSNPPKPILKPACPNAKPVPFPHIPLPDQPEPSFCDTCPLKAEKNFQPPNQPRTNLSNQLTRLTIKRDKQHVQLFKPSGGCSDGLHCEPQPENRTARIPQPISKTQNSVDPPNFSSLPDLGSGVGAGGKSGKFAGSSAPKRGRGILNQAASGRQPLCGRCNSYVRCLTNDKSHNACFPVNHPTNNDQTRVCHNCNEITRGPFITALGQIWCPEHFVCTNSQCRRPLQDVGFVEEKGQLYCEYCFERFIAPSCSKCNNKIKGDCLNAIGKHYHPECFNCAYCGKLFGNSPFFLEEGLPYCEADWNELFTTKCFACGFPVEAGDRWVEALNNNYHSQCFNCTMCKKNLEGQSFYAKGGRPFCKNHAR